jgi:hypothetical protein
MSTANTLTQAAKQDFMDRNKNLLALTKEGPNGVFKRVSSALALDTEAQSNVMLYVDILDQKGYAGEIARADFQREMYTAICKAFLKCQHNLVIEFATKLTSEALSELEATEVVAGLREAPAPVAPQPPQKSAAELLTEEVLHDWKFLPADKVKQKTNNRAYKAEFDRLMAADQLDSQITSLHDNGREFRS